jgi:hypothetical protein
MAGGLYLQEKHCYQATSVSQDFMTERLLESCSKQWQTAAGTNAKLATLDDYKKDYGLYVKHSHCRLAGMTGRLTGVKRTEQEPRCGVQTQGQLLQERGFRYPWLRFFRAFRQKAGCRYENTRSLMLLIQMSGLFVDSLRRIEWKTLEALWWRNRASFYQMRSSGHSFCMWTHRLANGIRGCEENPHSKLLPKRKILCLQV